MRLWQKAIALIGGTLAAATLIAATAVSPVQTLTCGTGQFFGALSSSGIFTCSSPSSGTGGAVSLISTVSATAGAANEMDFTGLGGTGMYELVCQGLVATNGDIPELQFGEGATPTWETTGSYMNILKANSDNNSGHNAQNTNGTYIFTLYGSMADTYPAYLDIKTSGLAATGVAKTVQYRATHRDFSDAHWLESIGDGGWLGDTNAITALRIILSVHTFSAGSCSLYGWGN